MVLNFKPSLKLKQPIKQAGKWKWNENKRPKPCYIFLHVQFKCKFKCECGWDLTLIFSLTFVFFLSLNVFMCGPLGTRIQIRSIKLHRTNLLTDEPCFKHGAFSFSDLSPPRFGYWDKPRKLWSEFWGILIPEIRNLLYEFLSSNTEDAEVLKDRKILLNYWKNRWNVTWCSCSV